MSNYTQLWFCNTTAEDEANYFFGESSAVARGQLGVYPGLKPGTYRVIDGEVYPITNDLPESIQN